MSSALPPSVLRFFDVRDDLSEASLRTYRRDAERFALFCRARKKTLLDADPALVRAFLATERVRRPPRAVARTFTALRQLYRFLLAEKAVPRSPAEEVRLPRPPPRRVVALTEEEVQRLRDARPDGADQVVDDALFETLLATGARSAELVALVPGDFDGAGRWLSFPKRRVPLSAPAVAAVQRYLTERWERWRVDVAAPVPLFLAGPGRTLRPTELRRRLRERGRRADLSRPVTPTILRHTLVQQLLRKGADVELVRRLLGWQELGNVEAYWVPDPEAPREVLEKFHPRA